MGCSRGVPGLFRAVPGCSGDVPGCSGGVPGCSGVFRECSGSVPGFTDTPLCTKKLLQHCFPEGLKIY